MNASFHSGGVSLVRQFVVCAMLVLGFPGSHSVCAHCDALDGPVVGAARIALAAKDVTPVLKWVPEASEADIRAAFSTALKVRAYGEEARKLADTHFFETLVRIHRAGEGEAYTGLRPAGVVSAGFAAADQALHKGTVQELAAELTAGIAERLRELHKEVAEKQKHADDNVNSGRAYVKAYVEYAHFVEALHELASGKGHPGHSSHAAEK